MEVLFPLPFMNGANPLMSPLFPPEDDCDDPVGEEDLTIVCKVLFKLSKDSWSCLNLIPSEMPLPVVSFVPPPPLC